MEKDVRNIIRRDNANELIDCGLHDLKKNKRYFVPRNNFYLQNSQKQVGDAKNFCTLNEYILYDYTYSSKSFLLPRILTFFSGSYALLSKSHRSKLRTSKI